VQSRRAAAGTAHGTKRHGRGAGQRLGPSPRFAPATGSGISPARAKSPESPLVSTLLAADFSVVSIDYRLAPETKLQGILEDVRDAFHWIRANAERLGVSPDRSVVCGGSAGGYLTLMTGFVLRPRPKALVSYWGYGDIVGAWYSRPDPFYSRQARAILSILSATRPVAAGGGRPRSVFE
jgi:alpha/beta hydrolase fold